MGSYIATVSETTRAGAEVVGNSLKSLLSRYQSIKARGFNEEDTTKINEVVKALKSVGISAVDSQGQLRKYSEVLDELAPIWESLDKNTKAYLQTTLAGIYQADKFAALMNNYSRSLELYEGALNSAGTAQQKFDIYMESSEAKMNTFKSTVDSLWLDTFNGTQFNKLIEFGTNVLNVVGDVGLLNTAITLLTVALMAFKGKAILTAIAGIESLGSALVLLATTPIGMAVLALGALGAMAVAYSNNMEKARIETEKLNKAVTEFNEALKSDKIDDITNALNKLANDVEYDKAIANVRRLKDEIIDLQNVANEGTQGKGFLKADIGAKTSELKTEENKVSAVEEAYKQSKYASMGLYYKGKSTSTSTKSSVGGTKTSTPDKLSQKDLQSEFDASHKKYIDAIKATEHSLTDLDNKSKDNSKTDLEKIQIEKDLIIANKKRQDALHAMNIQLDKEIKSGKLSKEEMEIATSTMKENSKEWWVNENAITSSNNSIISLTDSIKKAKEEQEKLIETTMKELVDTEKKNEEYKLFLKEHDVKEQIAKIDEKIDALANDKASKLEEQLEDMKEQETISDRELSRQEKLLAIEKQKQTLKDVQSEKNARLFVQGQGFVWVANPTKVKEEQEKLLDLQVEYDKWNAEQIKQAVKEKLQIEIENEKEITSKKKAEYEKQKDDLNKALYAEKYAIDKAYYDMDSIVSTRLAQLRETNNGNLDSMLADITAKLATAQTAYNKILSLNGSTSKDSDSGSSGSKLNPYLLSSYSSANQTKLKNWMKANGGDMKSAVDALGLNVMSSSSSNTSSSKSSGSFIKMVKPNGGFISVNPKSVAKYENKGYTRYANGTDSATQGVHSVNENGLELMWAGGGEKILPSNLSKQLLNLPNLLNNYLGDTNNSNSTIINVGEVKTNDATGFVNNLKRMGRR